MPITQAMTTSFKTEILTATHNFGTAPVRASGAADVFKIALYTSSATLDASTTAYTTSNEVSSSGTNYTRRLQPSRARPRGLTSTMSLLVARPSPQTVR
jgi:hypothetical protein